MATFLTDNFTAADGTSVTSHTPDSGGSWSLVSGGTVAAIHSNRAHGGAAFGYHYHSVNASADGESVTASLKLLPSGTTVGLLIRCANSGADFYMAFWEPQGLPNGKLTLWKKKSGSLASKATLTTFTPTGDHTMKLSVSGTGATVTCEVFFDGASKGTYADTESDRLTTLGSAGFFVAAATSSAGYHFDSITAEDSSSAAASSLVLPRAGLAHRSLITF